MIKIDKHTNECQHKNKLYLFHLTEVICSCSCYLKRITHTEKREEIKIIKSAEN